MSDGQQTSSRLAVLMFTDVVGSSELKSRLGTMVYARLLARHDALFRQLLAECPSAEVLQDTGDGYFAAFAAVSDAVRFALRFQDAMHREPWGAAEPLRTRVGIHLGELAQIAMAPGGPPKVVGMAADVAARLMSLARGGQILLTRAAFDEARQFVSEYPSVNGEEKRRALRWMAHGDYVFQGASEPVEVFEVGGDGIAPLSPPRDREKARRCVEGGKEEILGWRPAVGLAVPQTPVWVLERKLGEGTFGEVWLARHQKLKQHRVFKFCFDAERLESFKRELTLLRLLRDALGERPDIAKLYDVCLDRPPFFLESEYAPDGNLSDWAAARGGLRGVPPATRLEIVAQVCDAVAAAHSVGVLHKDIKPSNILLRTNADGIPRPQLTDFGIGMLTDRSQLAARHITEAGFTMMAGPESSRSGTRIYAPPESLAGRPFTTQGDIYALGVLLYQMTIADLDRPLALGWERGVEDELLREDIAACVDGDPERRIKSAAEVASRLRRLPERREQRAEAARHRETARRRHRLLRAAAAVAVAFCVLGALAVVGFFRERRLRVEAQTAYAAGAVDQGIALHLAGRGQQSRAAFVRARDAFQRLGVSTLPADAGIYRSLCEFDAPINTIGGHADGVMAVAWLPDGARVASAGEDGSVRLWDARTGRELRTFAKHRGLVGALAASPDGRQLLSGGKDRSIRLWDVESGAELRSFGDPSAEVRGVAFSPDGRRAVSGSYGPSPAVRLWDLETATQIKAFSAPGAPSYYGIAFSPDGRRVVATTYGQGDVWVWDVEGDRPPMRLEGHTGYAISATFSPDGRRILSASYDQTLRLWDAQTGSSIRPPLMGHAAGVRGAAFVGGGGDGTRALSCSMDGTLKLWDVTTGQVLRTFAGHTDGVRGVAVSRDGMRAVSGGIDRTLRVWDLRPNNEVPSVDDGGAFVTALACTPDGMALVSADATGGVTLRDRATLRTLQTFVGHDRPIDCATPLADGRRLFTADDTGHAKLWDLASGRELQSFARRVTPRSDTRIRSNDWCYTCVAPDGSIAISSSEDHRNFDVWSLESHKTLGTIGPHGKDITCLAISPDAKHALSGDVNGDMYYWDLTTRELLFKTPDRPKRGTLDCVTFSADGKTALAGGHDLVVRLWDLVGRQEVRSFHGHTLIVRTVGFGRDGGTIFSAGSDQTLRMFDAGTGREFDLAAQFPLPLYAMAVIPPGDAVAAASGPTISVWDLSRAARYVDDEPRVDAARAAIRANADDPAALATLGEWYAFRGIHDWAIELLERARAGGASVSSLALARCYWQLDCPADAAREYRSALTRGEAPAAYLNLCLAAVTRAGGSTTPTTTRARAPASP